ncbi:Phage repressor protein C, contains Cro/C1-type HTH and peptisase s24 domains [Pseudoxanthobacter soli DSM 19599]|uniref:Phage repressor protein C, contains Cro/C1-type HTH and peptisase s24 domains n=1 Tax=Pseudoxanthobacter soli DSM 19599 TaxID=1123029 RepID=A0A1M7ZCV3_9HYPH|nr:helix-turn-helix transcriptional regulator [Pseudoxanthobacter soli]SHO62693.1 Phage repressor protein C, contains Cro/C1-type HTH and peptisase s24 domains [Pseudoxanthobacter soli DSM 19599]
MLSHDRIWSALDALADRHGLTPSALARRAGLDPTTFNKSKRHAGERPRWPSTESIAKVLEVTGTDPVTFFSGLAGDRLPTQNAVPLLGMAQAGMGGFFDGGGYPAGTGWDEIPFPTSRDETVFALEVSGDSMLPAYRDGDVLIVSRGASVRRNDRVVVRTRDGEVMAKVLHRETARSIELHSLNPDHPPRLLATVDIDWMARILWASQ